MGRSRTATAGVAALERGLTILGAFTTRAPAPRARAPQAQALPARAPQAQALTLTELAQLAGFYKSTTLRLCDSLVRFQFLQRLDDGRFRLGPALFELGRLYQQSFEIGVFVRPAMRRLVERSGETASFYVREGGHDVCLHRMESPHPLRDAGIAEGDRFPIDDSACSRVLSAFSGEPAAELDQVSKNPVAFARQPKRAPGTSAMACPVFAAGRRLVGAMLLSGPESRFAGDAVPRLSAALVEEASRLTHALGGAMPVAHASGKRSPAGGKAFK